MLSLSRSAAYRQPVFIRRLSPVGGHGAETASRVGAGRWFAIGVLDHTIHAHPDVVLGSHAEQAVGTAEHTNALVVGDIDAVAVDTDQHCRTHDTLVTVKQRVAGTLVAVHVESREVAVYLSVILVPPIAIATYKKIQPSLKPDQVYILTYIITVCL